MAQFLDGPAAGVSLLLNRAPYFLRAVVDSKGNWDALDQGDDLPKPDETIYVYRILVATASRFHLCSRGRGGVPSGWYTEGQYKLVELQPSQEILRRDFDAWRQEHFSEYVADCEAAGIPHDE